MTLHDGPRVYLVASTAIRPAAMQAYLADIGGQSWWPGHEDAPDAQTLAEFGGKLCYRAWEPGLNPNVSKVRSDQGGYLRNILEQEHGSVLEHASYSFVFAQVSRVFTHELVRHRPGTAVSQESMRYVRLADIPFWIPDWLDEIPGESDSHELRNLLEDFLARAGYLQQQMAVRFGLDSMPFAAKKRLTSFMRRFAPDGVATAVLWTANVRALRHVIEVRTAPGAEEEMRLVFSRVAEIMVAEAPALFGDFTRQDGGAWTPEWSKV
jgi:thymidylate synthase (FAD)